MAQVTVWGSYKAHGRTNLVTGVAAGGHLLALQSPGPQSVRLRGLEISCVVLTAFTAAQEVGFEVFKATGFTAPDTGGLGVVPSRANSLQNASIITATQLQVANAAALTAGTLTLDTDRLASDSFWAGAVGAALSYRRYEFKDYPQGGILLNANEGLIVRNAVAMGAAGVVRWAFGLAFDEAQG